MTEEDIHSKLGTDSGDVTDALYELVLKDKVMEVGEDKYMAVDEINVKRLKKHLPDIF